MANALKGHVPLKAGKKSYTLVIGINALCMVEGVLGPGGKIATVLDELDKGPSLSTIRLMLWAGLQENHPCSLEEAGDIMAAATVPVASAAIIAGIAASFPPVTEGKPPNPPKAAAGTGKTG